MRHYEDIVAVEALERFKLKVRFESGKEVVYDVQPDIEAHDFYRPLAEVDGLFESVHVSRSKGFVVWEHESLVERIDLPNDILEDRGLEIAPPDPMYILCRNVVTEMIRLRKAAGLTQAELGQRAGVKQNVVARIETGRVIPRLDTMTKLMWALDRKISSVAV